MLQRLESGYGWTAIAKEWVERGGQEQWSGP